VFIKYEAKFSSRVSGGERGVVDFSKLFTETNERVRVPGHRASNCKRPTAVSFEPETQYCGSEMCKQTARDKIKGIGTTTIGGSWRDGVGISPITVTGGGEVISSLISPVLGT